jgi:hypothetical protein
LLRFGLAGDETGEDHAAVADALDPHVGVRQDLFDRGTDAVKVARDRNVEAHHLLAIGVEEEDVGLSDFIADHIGAARGTDHRIGNPRVADQDILDIAREVDDHRLAFAKRHRARSEIAGGDRDCLHLVIGGEFGRDGDAMRERREETWRQNGH